MDVCGVQLQTSIARVSIKVARPEDSESNDKWIERAKSKGPGCERDAGAAR